MNEIKLQFDSEFSHWEISLPAEALATRSRGKIVKSGWAIWYLFESDDKGEYLAENQRVAEMLQAKGFGIEGDEPGGVQMNRALRLRNR